MRVGAQIFQWSTNGHFYQPVSAANNISWSAANSAAVAAGGHLVTIASPEENAFVYSLIQTNNSVWNLVGSGHGPWIGAFQAANSPSQPEDGSG